MQDGARGPEPEAALNELVRSDFPAIQRSPERAYLDSAATSHRPQHVLDAEAAFLASDYAAVHRGSSGAVGVATESFEGARRTVADFVGVGEREVVWTENATDAINLVALGLSDASLFGADPRFRFGPGDEILITEAEHHANLVPWQRLAARTGATLTWIEVNEHGLWTIDDLRRATTSRTKLIAFSHTSNVTGMTAPAADVIDVAHAHGALTVLDACQSAPHLPLHLTDISFDFAAFSAHKMLGPTGIGALAGRAELLDALPPARTGGSMITTVTMSEADFLPAPQRFEAGTQPVSQAIAFGQAVTYLDRIGMDRVREHDRMIAARLGEAVSSVPGVRLVGSAADSERAALVSVVVDGVHAHDVGQFLDEAGVTVRTGHHCAQPLHRRLGVAATTRASGYVYTSAEDVDRFGAALAEVRPFFGVTT